jgi:perosamine synthetase
MSRLVRPALHGGAPEIAAGAHRPWPDIRREDRDAVRDALDARPLWGTAAAAVRGLEEDWSRYLGVAHTVALNSGTAALHCAAAAHGLGPGDEVIVPAFTFAATALAVAQQGAVPVFCDVDACSYNLDPGLIEERLSERTRAVLPVHLHGLPADMDRVRELADARSIAVIEDAAQAPGAEYRGRKTGTLGACAAFSLNATKPLCGGEGGLFVSDEPTLVETARRLAVFGEVPQRGQHDGPRVYLSSGLGMNYRNHVLSAALARSQLPRLDEYNRAAAANAAILNRGLSEIRGIEPPQTPPDRTHVFHKYRVRIELSELSWSGPPQQLRDLLIAALRAEGVDAVLWQSHPLPAHPVFRRRLRPWHPTWGAVALAPYDPQEFPVAERILASTLVLGSEQAPLAVQPPNLMEAYVRSVEKVMASLPELADRAGVAT